MARGVRIAAMSEARRRATYDDLLALPDDVTGEIVDGELIASPKPSVPHGAAGVELLDGLGPLRQRRGGGGRGGGPGGWHLLYEVELHLGDDVLVPDLSGWRVERLPALPVAPAIEVVPDWLCEILSPRTARLDRIRKMDRYAHHGVRHVWLVDPTAHTLEVFRLEGALYTRVHGFEEEARVRAEPFEAVELSLGDWWVRGA